MADSDYDQDADLSKEEVFLTDRVERDRYSEYFYDLYDDMTQFIEKNTLLILDQNNFDDFLGFCLENMNQSAVESDLAEQDYQVKKQNQEDLE